MIQYKTPLQGFIIECYGVQARQFCTAFVYKLDTCNYVITAHVTSVEATLDFTGHKNSLVRS